MDNKKKGPPPEVPQKSREEIMAERKAKKAEKASKKGAVPSASNPTVKPAEPKNQEVIEDRKANVADAKENTVEDGQGKSKAELRAERRAKQEAQRAAKLSQQQDQKTQQQQQSVLKPRVSEQIQADRPSVEKKLARKLASQQVPQRPPAERKVVLFSHLQQHERGLGFLTNNLLLNQGNIHPAIIRLGLQYADGVVTGSNARALALLLALKDLIADYSTPEQKELSRDLDARLKPCINFLKQCRPISVSMGNAIRYVKWHITHTSRDLSESQAKQNLYEAINKYIKENLELAGEAISNEAEKKIASGDVILTYGCSSLLQRIFVDAHRKGKKFRVVVLDSRPRCEGLHLLRRLAAAGISTSYMLISAAPYIMPEVTKVLLGAHALLANGNVMSRVGASQVALVAKAHNVPVLVCCETYKFSERVQTDSFVFNELGDPEDLVRSKNGMLSNWRELEKLSLLNLTYDVTPADLVTAVITELAILPCSSVPVVLRVKHAENAV